MNKIMNYQEINQKLDETGIKNSFDLVNAFYYGDSDIDEDTLRAIFGEVEIVDSEGDREGGGDYAMKVFLFKDHNVFIKTTGFYSSYNGTEWDENWSNVSPKEKTITIYE